MYVIALHASGPVSDGTRHAQPLERDGSDSFMISHTHTRTRVYTEVDRGQNCSHLMVHLNYTAGAEPDMLVVGGSSPSPLSSAANANLAASEPTRTWLKQETRNNGS